MLVGNGAAHHGQRGIVAQPTERFRIDPVALEAFGAAKPPPFRDELRLAAQNAKQHFLVIAEEEDRPNAGTTVRAQPLDDLGRVRAAVDEVSNEDQQGLRGGPSLKLGMNLRQQILKEVEPAMDVPHDIGPIARAHLRIRFGVEWKSRASLLLLDRIEPGKNVEIGADYEFLAKPVLNPRPRLSAHRNPALGGQVRYPLHRCGKRRCVPHGAKIAVQTILDDFTTARDVGRDQRPLHCRCLEQRPWQAFAI